MIPFLTTIVVGLIAHFPRYDQQFPECGCDDEAFTLTRIW